MGCFIKYGRTLCNASAWRASTNSSFFLGRCREMQMGQQSWVIYSEQGYHFSRKYNCNLGQLLTPPTLVQLLCFVQFRPGRAHTVLDRCHSVAVVKSIVGCQAGKGSPQLPRSCHVPTPAIVKPTFDSCQDSFKTYTP